MKLFQILAGVLGMTIYLAFTITAMAAAFGIWVAVLKYAGMWL